MHLGLLSDTHGHTERTAQAAERLLAAGVDHVIHAGDIGRESVLIELAAVFDAPRIPVTAVTGNVDRFQRDIEDFPSTTCVRVSRTASLHLADKQIGVIHGDDKALLDSWLSSGDYDIIITGHTHLREDTLHGSTRLINPGAIYRATEPGFATLDLDTGTLIYHDLK